MTDAAAPSSATTVTVFGAGVAGLTAAHELAQRGFRVLVVDVPSRIGVDEAAELGAMVLPICPRHLLDSMRRIPGPSGTVADALSVEPPLAMRAGRREHFLLTPTAFATPAAVYQQLLGFLGGSFGPLDVQMLFLRTLRYLVSCSGRRRQDCENASLLDYLSGGKGLAGLPAFRFSASATERIAVDAQLLTGVDAAHTDACGALNALLQLHVGPLFDGTPAQPSLKGSIEDDWFSPWRAQLSTLGVRFAAGALRTLAPAADGVGARAVVDWHEEAPSAEWFPSTYQIVATDVVDAERTSKGLRADVGVPAELQGLTTVFSGDPRQPERSRHVGRDPNAIFELGTKPWDRLRLEPHIDFRLPSAVPTLHGAVYLPDSPWKLQCVGAPADPGTVLRVTLESFSGPDPLRGETELTPDGFAREVWQQLVANLPTPLASIQLELPEYRLDSRLELVNGVVARCHGARFVAVAGDWARRPQGEPRAAQFSEGATSELPAELWARGGYVVHHGSLVFAGDYARTFTRLANVEAENESARHAVNAVLEHRASVTGAAPPRDLCAIFEPEACEPAALAGAKALDAKLLAQGLPHLFDLLALELLPRLASQRSAVTDDPLARLLALFEGFAPTSAGSPGGDSGSMLDVLRSIRQYLEQRVAGAAQTHDSSSES